MDTQPLSSPPKKNSEAGKAKGRSSKGTGVRAVTMDPQDEAAPPVPGEAGLRAVQSAININNTPTNTISTSPPAHHLAALRQVFGMPPPLEDLAGGNKRFRD